MFNNLQNLMDTSRRGLSIITRVNMSPESYSKYYESLEGPLEILNNTASV